jgi:hypothetical protein
MNYHSCLYVNLVAETVCCFKGLVIVGDRLAVGQCLGRLFPRLAEIFKSLGPLFSLRKMISECLALLGQSVCVKFLDGLSNEPMKFLAPFYQQ